MARVWQRLFQFLPFGVKMEQRGGGHEGEKKQKRKDKVKRKGHDSLELFLGIKSSSILIYNTTQLGFSTEFGAKTFWKMLITIVYSSGTKKHR